MTDDTEQLINELKQMKVEEAEFVTRKLWYCLIQALKKIDELELKLAYQQDNNKYWLHLKEIK